MYVDLWGNDVMTDPASANELQECVGGILAKCRGTVKMIHKSSNLTTYVDRLKEEQQLKQCLSLDCKCRWNSTRHMIENLLQLKQLIGQIHADKHELQLTNDGKQKLTSLELSSDEWAVLRAIEQILSPFDHATKLMSGQQYPTIGLALYAIRRIKMFLESYDDNHLFIKAMRDLLLEQIARYIDNDAAQLELIIVSIRSLLSSWQ